MDERPFSCLIEDTSVPLGNAMMQYALGTGKFQSVNGLARYDIESSWPQGISLLAVPDVSQWAGLQTGDTVAYSALGSFPSSAAVYPVNGVETDLDYNLSIARTAKLRGTKQYVIVIPPIAQKKSCGNLKQGLSPLEKSLIDVGFEKLILLQPGPIMDEISLTIPSGGPQHCWNRFVQSVYATPLAGLAGYPVYAEELAQAAVTLSLRLPNGVYQITADQVNYEVNRNRQLGRASLKVEEG